MSPAIQSRLDYYMVVIFISARIIGFYEDMSVILPASLEKTDTEISTSIRLCQQSRAFTIHSIHDQICIISRRVGGDSTELKST